METVLNKRKTLKFKKLMVEAGIADCNHPEDYVWDSFCLICKENLSQ